MPSVPFPRAITSREALCDDTGREDGELFYPPDVSRREEVHQVPDTAEKKHVCIHGHFYQPPRENPWLEEIEREDSAAPCHDWNERISSECYRPNTAARLVDHANRILSLHNNYETLSFNFGPTLLRWLELHDPWVYKAVLKADRVSGERLDGHGNAMAQIYNHIIMPLANRRDKITQVVWGIRDFEHRFGRSPEGMWLSETAVDGESLEIMAERGIRFTVLSPFQAARWRFLEGDGEWHDAREGSIPTGRAYRYTCPSGKEIHLFFFDASLSRGIAFEHLLQHSSRLLDRIRADGEPAGRLEGESWLIHAATDGESYGHHFKFGDMALAAAFKELSESPDTVIYNYGSFLASFPVIAEVEILENTSWSCAHGVGRWERDCGCHIGGGAGWNQQWRGPLREALNGLRDALAVLYERRMGRLCREPWRARDEYIDLLLDRDRFRDDFLLRHARKDFGASEAQRFFQLLEMQRCAMFMFTSCGWFFDDISGLESQIILRWAARAVQIAAHMGETGLERSLLAVLENASSNVPSFGSGAEVYVKAVKPEIVEKDRVTASYAIQALARGFRQQTGIHRYVVFPQHEEDLGANPVPCLFGHVRVRDTRTEEEESFLYAVLHFEALDFRCSVKPSRSDGEREKILKALQRAAESQSTMKLMRTLDEFFGSAFFSLQDAFRDLRSSIALEISRESLAMYTVFQRNLYEIHGPLMASLGQYGIAIPGDLRGAVRRVLSEDVNLLVERAVGHEDGHGFREGPWDATDFFFRAHLTRLKSLLDKARSLSVPLNLGRATELLGKAMVETLARLRTEFSVRDAGRLHRFIGICEVLQAGPELWELQGLFFEFIEGLVREPERIPSVQQCEGFLAELDAFLNCRFAHRPAEALKARSLSKERRALGVMKV